MSSLHKRHHLAKSQVQHHHIRRQKCTNINRRMRDNCVISRLMVSGNYEMIVAQIVSFLDIQSFLSLGQVCLLWRRYLSNNLRRFRLMKQFVSESQLWQSRLVFHRKNDIRDILGKLTDKVCQSYLQRDSQVLQLHL